MTVWIVEVDTPYGWLVRGVFTTETGADRYKDDLYPDCNRVIYPKEVIDA